MSLVRTLSRFAHDLRYEDLPFEVVDQTKLHILDALGVGFLGASTFEILDRVVNVVKAVSGEGKASVLGHHVRLTMPHAAFLNAIMFNSMYQPTHRASLSHPHGPVLSSALASGEEASANGKDLIAAVVAAYEIFLRMATAVNPSHLSRGLRTTGTMAPFAAVVACGKLLGLNRGQMKHALACAADFSGAGLIEAVAARPYVSYQTGANVWKGVMAAMLAKEGMTASETILEGGEACEKGFLQAYSDEYNQEMLTQGLGERFEIMNTGFSFHNAGSFSLTPIDAVLSVVREEGLKPEEIKIMRFGMTSVIYSFAKKSITSAEESSREAQLYFPFHIALALLKGRVDSDMFTDVHFKDPNVQAIMKKVEYYPDPDLDRDYVRSKSTLTSTLELTAQDGRVFTRKLDFPRGDPENPASKEEVQEKFLTLATKVVSRKRAEDIAWLVDRLAEVGHIEELTSLLRDSGQE